MPKINGKPVDPKAYAARVTNAKKIIAKMDPETKRKMPGMGPTAKVAARKPTQTPKSKPAPGPKFNSKKIQDMLTGKTPVLLNGKKPKTAEELKEAIRIKTGVYPNTSR